ncbi:MAG: hypothetical protein ACRD1X_11760 [Vicinamibacteria bacterium]
MSTKREERQPRRSVRELREALAKDRQQIESDLSALGDRFHDILSPRQLLSRHPILTAAVGAVMGYLIVRRPDQLLRAASRLAGLGAPLLLSALMKGDGSGSSAASEPRATNDDH